MQLCQRRTLSQIVDVPALSTSKERKHQESQIVLFFRRAGGNQSRRIQTGERLRLNERMKPLPHQIACKMFLFNG